VRIALVSELLTGRYRWLTSVMSPMAIATPTAAGRLRRRAATTAANADAMSAVMASVVRPLLGAARTPARPASAVVTIHTQTEILAGLTPDKDVIASVSTIALTFRPTSVNRRISVPITTTARTHPKAMSWSRVTVAPKIAYVGSGWLARPGADVMVSFPNSSCATGGRATDTPMVETILTSGDDRRRCRNSSR
jgi:hypothetical protein